VDYAEIARATKPVIEELDHGFLNHIIDLETTAENLAWWIGQKVKRKLGSHLYAIEVFETPTTSVSVEI
jgi:6-pyruvoyl-tetrahydropterin synthase